MGVEFKLSRNDHKKMEDFLARRPAGVTAITIDAHLTRYQAAAAEAARAAGVEVLIEPLTERLADPGFEPDGLTYHSGEPIALERLHRDPGARGELAEQVVAAQLDLATTVVPAHFYVHDDRSADLNLQLAQAAVQVAARRPVRALLVVKRKYAVARRVELARAYADLAVEAIELRVTPLGGDEESVQKIRSVFAITEAFRTVGLRVVLGCSGNIGQAALALGHVSGFSVGVGMREKVDHTGAISRQARALVDEDDHHHFGPQAGVYLPGPAATVRRAVAQAMLAERDIRTRIGCRMGSCANDITGPAADPRDHYLHARADEVAQLLARPPAWRSTMEADRLQRALDLRQFINSHYLPEGAYPLKTRTLRSLLEDIERQQRMSA